IVLILLFLKNLWNLSGLHYCLFVKVRGVLLRITPEELLSGVLPVALRNILSVKSIPRGFPSTQRIYITTTVSHRQALF
ncbi:MAG: hypothetical protein K1W20_07715, partial [Lachnospiraceae bacterium]